VVNETSGDALRVRKSLYSPGQQKIAAAIRDMRTGAKLTQRQLASRLKRPLNVISRIETAQRRVDFLEWISLCEACGEDPIDAGKQLLERLAKAT